MNYMVETLMDMLTLKAFFPKIVVFNNSICIVKWDFLNSYNEKINSY
uniref:Uncharacterized protein n=1 Tax=Rhizophora mucronata TaxID=61149 RepID=A0A2P2PJ64_RHIMU